MFLQRVGQGGGGDLVGAGPSSGVEGAGWAASCGGAGAAGVEAAEGLVRPALRRRRGEVGGRCVQFGPNC
jgi:hypothetical protein